MYEPKDILLQSILGEGGSVDPTQKADDIETHNENWQEKYSTQTYLEDTNGQSYSGLSSYWSILTSILTNETPKDDFLIPYNANDIAVLYKEDDGFYFWLPYHGARLKVYDNNGTVAFETLQVKDFGGSIEELEENKNQLESDAEDLRENVDGLKEVVFRDEKIYGFHIDSSESDPYACVTYLEDAVNMTPAKMDFTNDVFEWGSWGNAFFLPKPCMLKYEGEVDYYLNPNDYSEKEDGTASDVSDFSYPGNAMMEWGQNGKKIWYKIVPDSDPTSASVYIASYQADADYRCWSFINNQGRLVGHFYTPIYNGTLDTDGRLRSISGKDYTYICNAKTAAQEVTAAELNNPAEDKIWYTEVYSDITLINLLLILVGKSLDTQGVFGNGVQGQSNAVSSMISTGTADSKGMFWGDDDNTHAVKVFGIENWWGNQYRRYAGRVLLSYANKYKMTRGTQDGSTANDYVQSETDSDYDGYLTGNTSPSQDGYQNKAAFDSNSFVASSVGGTSSTYWGDFFSVSSGVRYPYRGGGAQGDAGYAGAFRDGLKSGIGGAGWSIGSCVSCKPIS